MTILFQAYQPFYLANNKDGYDLAFSPEAVHNELGMPLSTCRNQIDLLVRKGYLVPKREGSSVYDFYEKPRKIKTVETASAEITENEKAADAAAPKKEFVF